MFTSRRHWLEHKDDTTVVLLLASLFLGVLLLFLTFQFLVETFEQPTSALPLERPSASWSWSSYEPSAGVWGLNPLWTCTP